MNRMLKSLGLGGSLLAGLSGVAFAGLSLAGSSELPGSGRSLTTAPAVADLVAPAPEAYSSIVTTRDWQEVDTSGSKLTPRGASPTNSGFSGPPPAAPQRAEAAAASVPASTALASASSPAATTPATSTTSTGGVLPVVDTGTTAGSTPAGSSSNVSPEAAYLAALQATINQSEQAKDKPKTKGSKKAPRGTSGQPRP